MQFPLIAFAGYAHCGKDTAAEVLISEGYRQAAFGDIIKAQCDELIKKHLGFSAFTQRPLEKARIRKTLQYWGEDNYDNIFREFFEKLKPPAVNTRICKIDEAQEWIRRGGIIVYIERPGCQAETEWSREVNAALRNPVRQLIHSVVHNDSSLEDFQAAIRAHYL